MQYVTDPIEASNRPYKYFTIIAMAWVTALIVANLAVSKAIMIGSFDTFVVILIYPITYIFANCFTEVYGYRQTRKVIWSGLFIMAVVGFIVMPIFVNYPPHPEYLDNESFRTVFGNAPLYVLAGLCAFFSGEITNSYVLAKMKIWTKGKYLWSRTISSTLFAQMVDNLVYFTIAFAITQAFPFPLLVKMWASTVFLMVMYEIFATPLTYKIIVFLKKAEGLDVYDKGTDFNPFKIGILK